MPAFLIHLLGVGKGSLGKNVKSVVHLTLGRRMWDDQSVPEKKLMTINHMACRPRDCHIGWDKGQNCVEYMP